MKKRILLCNEASFIASGYGIHGKELLKRFHNSGKYEVAELGCYAIVDDPRIKNIPWKFYPNVPNNSNEKEVSLFKSNHINQYGLWRFNKAIIDFKPHIVFDVRDYWMYSYQEISPLRKYFKWAIMPTVDSAPQQTEWLYTFCNADVVIPYTEWAKNVLLEACGNKINLFSKPALAGVNPNEYYPIMDKKDHKKSYFGQDNLMITGLVLRNQKRKLIADMLLAYKKYLNNLKASNNIDLYDRSFLYLHTTYPEEHGWDLPSLLYEFGMLDKTYFTYMCRSCRHIEPCKFQNSIKKCTKCNQLAASLPNPTNSISTEKLNEVYNLFDIFIQYSICEGFGYPQIEAAACGVPIASVDYSAMSEILRDVHGFRIPVKRLFREMETNANRAYPDIDATTKILYDYFTQYDENKFKELSANTRKSCISKYTWDNVYNIWEECFDNIDISDLKDWNDPQMSEVAETLSVPGNLSRIEFIKYICDHIIKEPRLFYTAHIQGLLKDFQSGLVAKNSMIQSCSHQEIVSVLEQHLANKIYHEKLRLNSHLLQQEDFIVCHNP